jgi:hypothetical protein
LREERKERRKNVHPAAGADLNKAENEKQQ